MGLLRRPESPAENTDERFSGYEYLLAPNGNLVNPFMTWSSGGTESISPSFPSIVSQAYQSNGVVFAVILARLLLFSEARFKFRTQRNGRPGDLFGTPDLGVLERPWPNGTTGELLAHMEQDVSLAGNAFVRRSADRLERLRPDCVRIVSATVDEAGDGPADLLGYLYYPAGPGQGDPVTLLPEEVAHYSPIPDPMGKFAGMSWLTPVLREIQGDIAMSAHKNKFFENAATPNLVLKFQQKLNDDAFERLREQVDRKYGGADNAYKTMILEGGADATVVGADFRQMTFTDVQAAGENRIAAAAGVPGIVVGLKEGLQAATYSNYSQAMRRFVDLTMRPLWRMAAASLASIIDVPAGAELWYDDRDIAALREDAGEQATILQTRATTIKTLVDAGYDAASVITAVNAGDFTLLTHTGLFSVQLMPPGTESNPTDPDRAAVALGALRVADDAVRATARPRLAVIQRDERGLICGVTEE